MTKKTFTIIVVGLSVLIATLLGVYFYVRRPNKDKDKDKGDDTAGNDGADKAQAPSIGAGSGGSGSGGNYAGGNSPAVGSSNNSEPILSKTNEPKAEVMRLQRAINETLAFARNHINNVPAAFRPLPDTLNVDGDFGNKTEAAVFRLTGKKAIRLSEFIAKVKTEIADKLGTLSAFASIPGLATAPTTQIASQTGLTVARDYAALRDALDKI